MVSKHQILIPPSFVRSAMYLSEQNEENIKVIEAFVSGSNCCNRWKGRENNCWQVTSGIRLTSDWWRNGCKIFQPITRRHNTEQKSTHLLSPPHFKRSRYEELNATLTVRNTAALDCPRKQQCSPFFTCPMIHVRQQGQDSYYNVVCGI